MRNGALLNSSIGDYRLIDFLGAGGMGEVYRAVHVKLGRVVAVKVLTRADRQPHLSERFHNEARIQARLHHPRIATLFDFIETNGLPCIVMEYVDGQTLDERLRDFGALPLAEALAIFRAVVEAIGYVHQNGIVHRDIKSNNIKVNGNGEVKLLDFGIAKSGDSPQLTVTGDVIGTLQYLSPEQIKGGTADARSDIWALGVLLYELISGRTPFDATTLGRLCDSIVKRDYVRPSSLTADLPIEVEALIDRCLKKNPAARYQTAEELLADVTRLQGLGAAVTETPVRPQTPAQQGLAWAKGNWTWLSGAAVVTFAVLALVFLPVRPSDPSLTNSNTRGGTATRGETTSSTPAPDSRLRTVRINALEGKADVYQDGRLVGQTPFEIKASLGEQVSLVLKRDGFEEKPVAFAVTENKKEYTVTMSPSRETR